MRYQHLFTPLQLGNLSLPHRIVMAPLTRSRAAQPGDVPQPMNAEYYQQRASAALIISEATQISPQGKGYAFTPGIYSEEQIQGWQQVTQAVHQQGGKIFAQLWHVGRISHPALQPNGELPVAPSAIKPEGQAFTEQGFVDFETPRALDINDIPAIVEQYRQGALNAKAAGFDGIEIHAANGYLLDQFLKDGTNLRQDAYGGSISNRIRLTMEVVAAVTQVWNAQQVGIRISPTGTFNSMSESNPQALFDELIKQLNAYQLGYLHVVEAFAGERDHSFDFGSLKQAFNGAYMANGGYSPESAEASLKQGQSELVSFGMPYIANPDLAERFKQNAPLNQPDMDTLYGGDAKGYTDYASLA
ncbi:alkene reductase [Motilimonas pumila]|uniref:Alkene reductase n=1 Tax=Motilimonas pumila TaxID=2303987 RepID=A0A418YE88_9GAMM|nr:alkene reductase [Motilimonas pumila]RJG47427.1 alkene reductase [Motilimonas pumila]